MDAAAAAASTQPSQSLIDGEPLLIVGLQSGRSFNECAALLRLHGFEGPERPEDSGPRCLRFSLGRAPPALGGRRVRYVLVKPRDVAEWLRQGIIHIAACFDDAFEHLVEKEYSLKPLRGFVRASGPDFAESPPRLAICGRAGLNPLDPMNRLVAEYEDGERLLRQHGFSGQVFFASGGSEGAICAGLADAGLMVVQTGKTLEANGLQIYKEIRELKLNLWCHTASTTGLWIYQTIGPSAPVRFVRVGGLSVSHREHVVAALRQQKDLRDFVICAVGDELCRLEETGSFAFVLDDPLGDAGQRETWRVWAARHGAMTLTSLNGIEGHVQTIASAVLSGVSMPPADLLQSSPQDTDPAQPFGAQLIGSDVALDTLTDEEFQRLPLVIRGESKEVRYIGKGLVVIKFLPTIYSFTQNRAAEVPGSDKLRLRADHIFVTLLRAAGLDHAYLKITDRWVLARLVMPHAVEFEKYGLPQFTPQDLSPEQLAAIPRGPPIEIIVKTFHGGTSKHRYRDMSGRQVRDTHPLYPNARVDAEAPYPEPLVRFDWRNPLTMRFDPQLKPPDVGRKAACEAFLAQLPEYREQFTSDFQYGQVEEFLETSITPADVRVPDEILPEALANYFIDVKKARATALNVYHVLQTFLDSCDIVCNDLCLFITEDGGLCYGEISQDCGRFRHFDLGSLDKDVWRAGGSSSHVLDKWAELARLLELGWQKGLPKQLSLAPPGGAHGLELFVGTTNPYKTAEISSILQHLGFQLVPSKPFEVPEPYSTFRENARAKALAYAEACGGLTIAEDSGIAVEALGGLPGPWSARFSDFEVVEPSKGLAGLSGYVPSCRPRAELDAANNRRLLEVLEGRAPRTASFRVAFCVARPGCVLFEAEAEVRGEVTTELRGENGFGYDPVFVGCDTSGLTYAELDRTRKSLRSHRRAALKDVGSFLVQHIICPKGRPCMR